MAIHFALKDSVGLGIVGNVLPWLRLLFRLTTQINSSRNRFRGWRDYHTILTSLKRFNLPSVSYTSTTSVPCYVLPSM